METPTAAPPQHRYYKPIKEEPLTHLHDASDLISFRTDAMSRFIRNQELMEAIGKYIHSDKIVVPRLVPDALELAEGAEPTYSDIYFGDLKVMKQMSSKMDREVNEIRQELEQLDKQLEAIKTGDKNKTISVLTEQSHAMEDAEGFRKLMEEYAKVDEQYKRPQFRRVKYQIPKDVVVEEAPADYDPNQSYYYPMGQMGQMEHMEAEIPVDQMQGGMNNMAPITMDGGMDADMFLGDDMMNGIDEDFLSQIDHSME